MYQSDNNRRIKFQKIFYQKNYIYINNFVFIKEKMI